MEAKLRLTIYYIFRIRVKAEMTMGFPSRTTQCTFLKCGSIAERQSGSITERDTKSCRSQRDYDRTRIIFSSKR